MFSRPVSSGWKPVPTSSRLATRPLMVTRPAVGSVMRERIFSSVDLPAPLRPMMPTTSPRLTSKETSFSAQNSSTVVARDERAAAQHVAGGAREAARAAGDDVAQRGVALALGLVADQVFLAEALGADDDVAHGHRQIRSAKVRSVRRK